MCTFSLKKGDTYIKKDRASCPSLEAFGTYRPICFFYRVCGLVTVLHVIRQTLEKGSCTPHLALELEQSIPILLHPLCAFAACNWEDSTFTCIELSCVKSCIKLIVH
jgi:hypothetical protein